MFHNVGAGALAVKWLQCASCKKRLSDITLKLATTVAVDTTYPPRLLIRLRCHELLVYVYFRLQSEMKTNPKVLSL